MFAYLSTLGFFAVRWATFILNSIGVIYGFGIFNGAAIFERNVEINRLNFPPAYPPTTVSRYEPSTAIQQFSTGRSHVLGLADNGTVWYWRKYTAIKIQLSDVGISEENIERAVAGWDRSSLYVNGTGIVYWPPPHVHDTNSAQDAVMEDCLQIDPVIIPSTGYRRNRNDRAQESLASRIGVVTNHIVLEGYIVFITDHDKIFSFQTKYPVVDFPQPEPVELTTFYSESSSPFQVRDIQGSFRSFAIFTKSGSVLTASCPLLDIFHLPPDARGPLPHPNAIPGLQGQSIISLAFGDHHFHALHTNGTITSYGTESQGCGALGLGDKNVNVLRGVRRGPHGFNRMLRESEGRTVWFDPMMYTWLQEMSRKSGEDEAQERARMVVVNQHNGACNAFADYFEQEGRKWEDGLTAEGELGAYFVLKVSAAGWHSAALVLVDEKKAELARQKHLIVPPSGSSPPINDAVQPTLYGLAWFYTLLIGSVRWFLGLTARDATAAKNTGSPRRRNEGHPDSRVDDSSGGNADDGVVLDENEEARPVYTWSHDPFPRLRMADGEVMPGEIEITESN
ncbi:hypothetical protein MMC07_001174 [Pseudocyphellaria aurata]|nr:hypothetical protein [Pseudocyphellaria aurata]